MSFDYAWDLATTARRKPANASRCDFYAPKPSTRAQLVEAKASLQRMLVVYPAGGPRLEGCGESSPVLGVGGADAAGLELDVPVCPRCGGRWRLSAPVEEPGVVRQILNRPGRADSGPGPPGLTDAAPAPRGRGRGDGAPVSLQHPPAPSLFPSGAP